MIVLNTDLLLNIIRLLMGVAMFLFGMSVMGDGLKKVAGNKLEIILYKLSGTTLRGVLLGTGVTAVIQSSSATSVMVVGFVNSGMMKVRQAVGVILGAILGTSITGWIISLNYIDLGGSGGFMKLLSTSTLTALIAIAGIILRMFSKVQLRQRIGDIMLGFAVLMLGMETMSGAMGFLKESESFKSLLTSFSNPFLGILIGIVFTSILQSASAAVGILQALAFALVSTATPITFSVAFPIIMGICIGAAVPVLLSALGASTAGKRTALIYLIVQVIGVAVISVVFYTVNLFAHFDLMGLSMDPVSIALVNTVFRLVMVLLLCPFTNLVEKLVMLLVKDQPISNEEKDMLRLEERFLQHPALAIEQSRLTINSMAKAAQENLTDGLELLRSFSEKGFRRVQELEGIVDKYEDCLGSYLVKVTGQEMTPQQNEAVSLFLHTISDFERISDHALNIGQTAQEIFEKKLTFSDPAIKELTTIIGAISEVVDICVTAFVQNDLDLATKVEPLEQVIDGLCDTMKMNHVERLQKGTCTLLQGFVFNDMLTNFERIGDHCSNIAIAMIELHLHSFDTHGYTTSLRAEQTPLFQKCVEEYSRKYAL